MVHKETQKISMSPGFAVV